MSRSPASDLYGPFDEFDSKPFTSKKVVEVLRNVRCPLVGFGKSELTDQLNSAAKQYGKQVRASLGSNDASSRKYLQAVEKACLRLSHLITLAEADSGLAGNGGDLEPAFGIERLLKQPLHQEMMRLSKSDLRKQHGANYDLIPLKKRYESAALNLETLFGTPIPSDILSTTSQFSWLIAGAARKALGNLDRKDRAAQKKNAKELEKTALDKTDLEGKSEAGATSLSDAPAKKRSDGPEEELIGRLLELYGEAFHRKIKVSTSGNTRVGPLVRFVQSCCAVLKVSVTPDKIKRLAEEYFPQK